MGYDRLTTLPQELQHCIITYTDRLGRLSLFRTSKQLRDAVLGHQPATSRELQQQLPCQEQQQWQQQGSGQGSKQQSAVLRTRLFLAAGQGSVDVAKQRWAGESGSTPTPEQQDSPNPGVDNGEQGHAPNKQAAASLECMPAAAAACLLRLAATSAHDMHLYLRQVEHPVHKQPTADGGGLFKGHSKPAGPCRVQQHGQWLTDLLSPWLMPTPITPSLHHLTALWLQDMQLPSPLPERIQQACPASKQLELCRVQFPAQVGSSMKPWPQLQQLTLRSTDCVPIAPVFTTTNLPGLVSLSVLGSIEASEAQAVANSCKAFRGQLVNLTVHMVSAGALTTYMTAILQAAVYPQLTRLDLPSYLMCDREFVATLKAAPALLHLSVSTLWLRQKHTDKQWTLQHLHVSNPLGRVAIDIVCTLLALPHMPQLQQIDLGPGGSVNVGQVDLGQLSAAARAGVLERVHMKESHFEVHHAQDTQLLPTGAGSGPNGPAMNHTLYKVVLLRPLHRDAQCLRFTSSRMTRGLIHALGDVHANHVAFNDCTWEQSVLGVFWNLMPRVTDVYIMNAMAIDQLQLLCSSASRPVSVHVSLWIDRRKLKSVSHALKAAGKPARLRLLLCCHETI